MKKIYCTFLFSVGIFLLNPLRLPAQPDTHPKDSLEANSTVKTGKAIYVKNCSGCHGEKGQGFAGPNLTDKYWIHGGSIKDIMTSIQDGIPDKGMIAWKIVFSPGEIQTITDYVRSLQGTNPPKAKKPEGKLYNG